MILTKLGYCAIVFAVLGSAIVEAQVAFAPPVDLAAAVRPDGVAAGDFDQDGDRDLVVTVDTQDRFMLFLNDGTGQLLDGAAFFTGPGTGPDDVAAADLDGDGDLDLAVLFKNLNSLAVFLGDGAGNFTPGEVAPVGLEPTKVTVADFNGDGSLDLATANRDGNSVTVLTNLGPASFVAATVSVGLEPRSVVSGDFDQDGDLDLAVTNHDSRSVSVLTNNAGAFVSSAQLSVGATLRPEGIDVADVDNDGDLDLAVATSGNGQNFLSIFVNAGGLFTGPTHSIVTGQGAGGLVAADFDGDGFVDVAISNEDTANMAIMAGNGTPAYALALSLPTGIEPGNPIAADLTGDSRPELVVANRDSNTVRAWINSSSGGPVGSFFVRGDANGSGDLDVADAVTGLSTLFVPGFPQLGCRDSGDANDDGTFDVSDMVFLLAYLFQPGSPAPAAPGTTCGADPTADALDCAVVTCP